MNHKRKARGSLMDRGANNGIAGYEVRVIRVYPRTVNVSGIDDHQMTHLKIVDCSAKVKTQKGWVILIMCQYALHAEFPTIHSAVQIEAYKNDVNDKPMKAGGTQCVTTNDGYVIPLDLIHGLPYMKMYSHTDEDWNLLPHVFLTSNHDWDPDQLDFNLTNREDWYALVKEKKGEDEEKVEDRLDVPFNDQGRYLNREQTQDNDPDSDQKKYETDDDEPPAPPGKNLNDTAASKDDVPELYESDSDDDDSYVPPNYESDDDDSMPDLHEPVYDSDSSGSDSDDDESVTEEDIREAYRISLDLNARYVVPEKDDGVLFTNKHKVEIRNPIKAKKNPPIPEKYRYFFLGASNEKIKKTFEATTQYAPSVLSGERIRRTLKTVYPAVNVPRRHEPVATDTIDGNCPSICGGHKSFQLYVGTKSKFISIHPMHSHKEFVNTLEDEIRRHGAMDKLISDSAAEEHSKRTLELLRVYRVDDWRSEAYFKHQNPSERRWQDLKGKTNWIMNLRNVPEDAWLLATIWTGDVLNHTAEESLIWRTPIEVRTGQTPDISKILIFIFWDRVATGRYDDSGKTPPIGSAEGSEITGRFVGFSKNVGHQLTFMILTDDTKKIIHRSRVRLLADKENDLPIDIAGNKTHRQYIHSRRELAKEPMPIYDVSKGPVHAEISTDAGAKEEMKLTSDDADPEEQSVEDPGEQSVQDPGELEEEYSPMMNPLSGREDTTANEDPFVESLTHKPVEEEEETKEEESTTPEEPVEKDYTTATFVTPNPTIRGFTPEQMIGKTFLLPPEDDGTRQRAKIKEFHIQKNADNHDNKEYIKFRCIRDDKKEEIVALNDIADYIEHDESWDGLWKFRRIVKHKGPLKKKDKDYQGSLYNVLVEWSDEGFTRTWVPLKTLIEDDPVTVAAYARANKLMRTQGWLHPRLKRLYKSQKTFFRAANQAKLQSFRHKPVYMYGYKVPRNYRQALEFDDENGNNKWRIATEVELAQIDEYDTFKDMGEGYHPGSDWKRIDVHLVYAVKHDGRHKARLVAGGHLTDTPIDSVYSSVVSL